MTDQERADLELSLAMIDQASATQDATKATKDLTDAIDMEVDASLDLTDVKTQAKKAIDQELNVSKKSADISDDLNYSRTEQARIEKNYLNILARRAEIEKKIGLVDYGQISKEIHDKIVAELEEKLRLAQESNDETEEEDETEKKQRKSDSDYLKEAEKFHKKQKGVFKRISESHQRYMQTSSSFLGRLAMGALGKGASELTSLVDNVTDMVPGAKTAKRVGGFVRDQWRVSKEAKRQRNIQATAKMLRARDEAPSTEGEDRRRDEDRRKRDEGNRGIFSIGETLAKIFTFLKKFAEITMIMGAIKGLFSLVGGALSGLGNIIASGFKTALAAVGIMGVLKSLLGVVKGGLGAIAGKFGISLPDSFTDDADKEKNKNKNRRGPRGNRPPPSQGPQKPGFFKRLGSYGSKALKGGAALATSAGRSIAAGGANLARAAMTNPLTLGAAAMVYSGDAGDSSDMDVDQYNDPEVRAEVARVQKESILKAEAENYKDSFGNKSLVDENGNVQYYPNEEKDPDKTFENERRFKMDVSTGMVTNDERTFNELQGQATALEKVKAEKAEASRQGIINSIGQQNTINNINSSYQTPTTFGFSPYEYSSRDKYSRGEVK